MELNERDNVVYSIIDEGNGYSKIRYFNQKNLNKSFKELGNILLNKKYRDNWAINNPTYGYCYILSEVIYHYCEGDFKVYCVNLKEQGINGVHWYLKDSDGKIIDYTGNQFGFEIDYNKGKGIGFLKGKHKTERGYISDRGKRLAKYFGLN